MPYESYVEVGPISPEDPIDWRTVERLRSAHTALKLLRELERVFVP